MTPKNISSNDIVTSYKLSQTRPDPLSRKSIEKALLHFLISQFANTFFEKERRPLKIGITEDILNWFESNPNDQIVVNTSLLKSVLGTYTSNPKYMLCLQADIPRLDLAGQPAGRVTLQEAEQAKNKLKTLHDILSAKHLKKKLTAQAEAIKISEALRQNEKAAKQKKTSQLKPYHNPILPTNVQPSSAKSQPIIRFIRKRLNTPSDQK